MSTLHLPRFTQSREHLDKNDRRIMKEWGIGFGKVVDTMWCEGRLPEGWQIKTSGYHGHVYDQFGRQRTGVFRKEAMYDYDVFMYPLRRFSANVVGAHKVYFYSEGYLFPVVYDGGIPVWVGQGRLTNTKNHSKIFGQLQEEATDRLKEMLVGIFGHDTPTIQEEWGQISGAPKSVVISSTQADQWLADKLEELKTELNTLEQEKRQIEYCRFVDFSLNDNCPTEDEQERERQHKVEQLESKINNVRRQITSIENGLRGLSVEV